MPRKILIVVALALLVSTVGVTVIGLASRAAGTRALTEVLARHAAEGYGTTVGDLVAMAPSVDADRQARLYVWMRRNTPSRSHSVDRDLAWLLRDELSPAEETLTAHAAFRPEIEVLESLFGEGDLCLSSLGWMPADPESASVAELISSPIPNLLRMRAAYSWYAVEAGLADDPSAALRMLGRLHESTARAGCLIDSMISVACDAMRDDAFVVLALFGRCPPAELEAWLRETPRAARLVADGLRGERLRFGAPLARDLARGGSVQDQLGRLHAVEDVWDTWDHHVRPWATAASECAVYLEGMVALERFTRGEIEREEKDERLAACEGLGYPFSLMLPNQLGIVSVVASADRHRLVRAAVVLAQEGDARGTTPESEAEALEWVRALRPGLLPVEGVTPLRYHRLAADRFRVAMDFQDRGDPLRRKDPAGQAPLDLGHGFLEIQVR